MKTHPTGKNDRIRGSPVVRRVLTLQNWVTAIDKRKLTLCAASKSPFRGKCCDKGLVRQTRGPIRDIHVSLKLEGNLPFKGFLFLSLKAHFWTGRINKAQFPRNVRLHMIGSNLAFNHRMQYVELSLVIQSNGPILGWNQMTTFRFQTL